MNSRANSKVWTILPHVCGVGLSLCLLVWTWEASRSFAAAENHESFQSLLFDSFLFGPLLFGSWAFILVPLLLLPLVFKSLRHLRAVGAEELSMARIDALVWVLVLFGVLLHLAWTFESRGLGPLAVQIALFERLGSLGGLGVYTTLAACTSYLLGRSSMGLVAHLVPASTVKARAWGAALLSVLVFLPLLNVVSVFASGAGLF